MFIIEIEMDYTIDKLSSIFIFNNPNEKSTCGCGEPFNFQNFVIMKYDNYFKLDEKKIKSFLMNSSNYYIQETGLELGFKVVESGPLVRSSYHADTQAKLYQRQ